MANFLRLRSREFRGAALPVSSNRSETSAASRSEIFIFQWVDNIEGVDGIECFENYFWGIIKEEIIPHFA